MPAPETLPARLIGALFVERGLVSESQIRVALEIQRETGQQLGQVLVERFGVSRKELASVVAEQWAKLGGSSGPEDSASWRRLGDIFVERGFVTEDELQQALTRQRQTGERLGEALVAQGVISKFELAGALAEQMAAMGESAEEDTPSERAEATVHHLPTRTVDPAEVPFGAVIELEPTRGPEHEAAEVAEHVADEIAAEAVAEPALEAVTDDVGEAPLEAEDGSDEAEDVSDEVEDVAVVPVADEAAEVVPVADEAAEVAPVADEAVEVASEVVAGVVDDAEVAPYEPVAAIAIDDVGHVSLVGAAADVVEHGPTELFEDLRDAIAADAPPEDGRQAVPTPAVGCLAFAPTTEGYRLVLLESLPEPGETVVVPDVGERLVLRVGRSPLPGDGRPCAYVEEPVTPAPVAALVH